MNRVILYGGLKEEFGEGFDLDVRDPAEAFRAMHSQLPGFSQMCVEGDYIMVRELPDGTLAMSEDMLFIGMSNTTLHFLPNVEGANKGTAKMVIGAALFVGSLFIPGGFILSSTLLPGLSVSTGMLATMGMTMGLALAFGGAALLLAPTPKMDDAKDSNSFIFSGDSNTAGQGFAVPVTYGYDRVRPIPIATQIKTNEYHVAVGDTYVGDGDGTNYVGIIGQDRIFTSDA